MKKIILVFFIFVVACVRQTNSLPDWYLKPVNNDTYKLYGIGYGANLDDATKSALNNLSERLKIEISSSYESSKQEASINNNSEYAQNIRQKVKAKIAEIEINNYFVEQTTEQDGIFYVSLSVDKSELATIYKKKILARQANIKALLDSLEDKSVIEKLSIYNQLVASVASNENYIDLLRIITKNQNELNYLTNLYQNIKVKELQNKDNLIVNIVAKSSDFRIADLISASFNNLNIATVNNQDTPNDKRVAILRINTETIHQEIYANYMVKILINFKLVEKFGKQISANKIEVSAASVISSNEAVNAALVELKDKITAAGIYQIIGL